jgi:NMD protein affecting ribosome stability and mRNA decay
MKSLTLRPQRRPRNRRTAGHAQLDHILDPYQHRGKLPDGTTCAQCGATVHEGRWTWMVAEESEAHAHELCPACRRINDRFPAGVVTLHGPFALAHKDELVRMARRQEEIEKPEHPLDRIMAIEEDAEGLTITTTDIHLPRRIGETIKRTWRGTISVAFEEDGYFVRVSWRRDGEGAGPA